MAFFEGNNMTGGYGNGPDIINSCSVNVERGEIVSILGPNGAGKSTAMKAMLGLLNLKSGSITIGGKDISAVCYYENPNEKRKRILDIARKTFFKNPIGNLKLLWKHRNTNNLSLIHI